MGSDPKYIYIVVTAATAPCVAHTLVSLGAINSAAVIAQSSGSANSPSVCPLLSGFEFCTASSTQSS